MEFEYFGLSRDLLYLCSLLSGAALSAFFVIRRKDCTLRRKSIMTTLILCLSSCIVAALAVSIILTEGHIFSVGLIYPFVILFFLMGGAVLYSPRIGCYAIIFAAGIFTVYICFSFLTYPGLQEPDRLVVRSSGTELFFRLDTETREIRNDQRMVSFQAVSISAHPSCPVIGGNMRGLITRVSRNEEELFVLVNNAGRLSSGYNKTWGFRRENFTLDLPLGSLPPGISLSVLFDGKRLYCDPPIQL